MKPSESLLKAHLEGAAFLAGVDAGKWGIGKPVDETGLINPLLWVSADKRVVAEGRLYLKFDTNMYPQQAPTACPWDIKTGVKLPPSAWPKGGNATSVFNPGWKDHALYSPCDRVAMAGHETWQQQSPQWWWNSSSTIVLYLQFVYACLNPADYEYP